MKEFINTIKKVDKSVFGDPMLRPFKDLEIVLRGIPEKDYNAVAFAVVNNATWTPHAKAVKKIQELIDEITRIDYTDVVIAEGMEVIDEALRAVFDSRILLAKLVNVSVKRILRNAPKEFSNRVTVFVREVYTGPGRFTNNFILDFYIDDEVMCIPLVLTPVNNFKHFLEAKDTLYSNMIISQAIVEFDKILALKAAQ